MYNNEVCDIICGIMTEFILRVKLQPKVHFRTGNEGPEAHQTHRFTLSLTSTLDAGVLSKPSPGRFIPGKERPGTHFTGGWVGPQGRSGRVRKIWPLQGFDPRTVQPVASRYTD
jgi:hypothetical protein